ncbi:Gag-Pol polyprotein, partial [Nosema granulosis]
MVNGCEICQSRRGLVTRPIIRPIIAEHQRERYIVDLVDFRYYSDVNDGVKWMLIMVDSFSKYMWTVPLKEKSASAVVPAIRTIFMTFGPSFLLNSDNGREFCNEPMKFMLEEFNVRHVRGRARCPWIQGQVERANQTIKWMIGSRLLTLNTPGRWISVRESSTYSYNHM